MVHTVRNGYTVKTSEPFRSGYDNHGFTVYRKEIALAIRVLNSKDVGATVTLTKGLEVQRIK